MRFNFEFAKIWLPLIMVLQATEVVADAMTTFSQTFLWPWPDKWLGVWETVDGSYNIGPSEGCRDASQLEVPGMWAACFDWPNGRGHFNMDGQDNKRCIRQYVKLDLERCGTWWW